MHQTKLQRQREVERARTFHKRVALVIAGGFALIIAAASVLILAVG